jgi:rhamnulokinase
VTDSFAAVDLGATSGRVILGHVAAQRLALEEVHRFDNRAVRIRDGLHWPVAALYQSVVDGLAQLPPVRSVGIDGWAVDYALMRAGRMLSLPYSYRDERNNAAVPVVHAVVPPAALYARNGLQHLPFNTLFQLTADRDAGLLALADSFQLLPDLFAYWLTGVVAAERTNASTTGLLGVASGEWDLPLAAPWACRRRSSPRWWIPGRSSADHRSARS